MTRLFVVNYRFVFCGDVFTDGLRHAAADLGIEYEGAYWDDPHLRGKIERFNPDLIFVVHGRKFAAQCGGFGGQVAVWLVDEPYETDDTAKWSGYFDTVFVNDPAALHRHKNAHYLPMCCDPHVHKDIGAQRIYKTGFVGNYSPSRLRYLSALADAGLLGYVVGARWRNTPLSRYCIDGNVPPQRTAELYQQTQIVVNVFREGHQWNARKIQATAMNPRIYEALACGAVVVSERRAGVFPDVPQFESSGELVDIVRKLLANQSSMSSLREWCNPTGHTYADRLSAALEICTQTEVAYA